MFVVDIFMTRINVRTLINLKHIQVQIVVKTQVKAIHLEKAIFDCTVLENLKNSFLIDEKQ